MTNLDPQFPTVMVGNTWKGRSRDGGPDVTGTEPAPCWPPFAREAQLPTRPQPPQTAPWSGTQVFKAWPVVWVQCLLSVSNEKVPNV